MKKTGTIVFNDRINDIYIGNKDSIDSCDKIYE